MTKVKTFIVGNASIFHLTPEQKIRLANDEACGVKFSENKRMLKSYVGCTEEPEEWIKNGYSVPDFVTAIGAEAFSQKEAIQVNSIVLPEGLTRIGPRAFEFCAIKKVLFSSTLKTIGDYAFFSTSLKEITLPESLCKIGREAFASCTGLQSVTMQGGLPAQCSKNSKPAEKRFSANLKVISYRAFEGCRKLKTFIVPDGVETIESEVFAGCSSLQSIFLPDSLIELGCYVFDRCSSLTDVRLPANLKIIQPGTFSGCTSLENIIIPDGVQKIDDRAFENCPKLRSHCRLI